MKAYASPASSSASLASAGSDASDDSSFYPFSSDAGCAYHAQTSALYGALAVRRRQS